MKKYYKDDLKLVAVWFLYVVIACIYCVCLSGCGVIKKAIDEKRTTKAKAQFDRHPDTAAHYCEVHFPLVDSPLAPIYKPADNANYQSLIDSLYQLAYVLRANLDSIRKFIPDSVFLDSQASLGDFGIGVMDGKAKPKPAPFGGSPFWSALDSLHDHYKPCVPDTVFQPSLVISSSAISAANYRYQNEHAARIRAETLSSEYQHKATVRVWMLIAAGLLILLLLFLYFRK